MKNITLLIFALLFNQLTAHSQPCLPEGITFTTQEQIDNFQINYPDCTEIEGDVTISGDDITNLMGLNVMTSFQGDLLIKYNESITSLTGLDNVSNIGGDLLFKRMNALTNLTGLENLTAIGGSLIIGAPYSGGPYGNGTSLVNLSGLDNLISIGGHLEVIDNYALISLSGLTNLTSIGGGLEIMSNSALTNLTGLANLNSVGEGIIIGGIYWDSGNPSLTSLSGLDNIEAGSINYLNILSNTSLSSCAVQSICDYLASPNGGIWIWSNAPGCNSPEEVEEACETTVILDINSEGNLTISPNPIESSTVIEYSLYQNSPVTLQIFDLRGQVIVTPVNEFQRYGEHKVILNGKGLKPGVYFCVLKTNPEYSGQTIKMIKL